ncbi:YfhO family protein, partial [Acidobacteriota bacterium]
ALGEKGIFYLVNVYLGVGIPVLIWGGRARRYSLAWGTCGIAALMLAYGKHLPLFGVLHDRVPLLKLVRYPEKFLVLVAFCLAMLGAAGADRLFRQPADSRVSKRLFVVFLAICIVALICGTAVAISKGEGQDNGFAGWLFSILSDGGQIEAARRVMTISFLRTGLIAFLGALLCSRILRKRVSPVLWTSLLCILVLGDLLPSSLATNPTVHAGAMNMRPIFAQAVSEGAQGGVYIRYRTEEVMSVLLQKHPGVTSHQWIAQGLGLYLTTFSSGCRTAFADNIDGLLIRETEAASRMLYETPPDLSAGVLKSAGVRYVATNYDLPRDQYTLLRDFGGEGWPVRLYEVNEGRGPVYCVPRVRTVSCAEEAISLLSQGGYDPYGEAFVEREISALDLPSRDGDFVATCKITYRSDRQIDIDVYSENPCLLIGAMTFYPGWKTTVDGKGQETFRANGRFLSTPLQAGKHRVSFLYEPESVRLGKVLSGLGLLGIMGLWIMGGARRLRAANRRTDMPDHSNGTE